MNKVFLALITFALVGCTQEEVTIRDITGTTEDGEYTVTETATRYDSAFYVVDDGDYVCTYHISELDTDK